MATPVVIFALSYESTTNAPDSRDVTTVSDLTADPTTLSTSYQNPLPASQFSLHPIHAGPVIPESFVTDRDGRRFLLRDNMDWEAASGPRLLGISNDTKHYVPPSTRKRKRLVNYDGDEEQNPQQA